MNRHWNSNADHTLGDAVRMHRLAERPLPKGRTRLRPARGTTRRLSALLEAARRMSASDASEDEALSRLARGSRVIDACAKSAASKDGERLPAWRGVTRIEAVLAPLCDGEAPLTRERLLHALEAFDAVQGLTMAELWAAPQAARVALTEALLSVATRILARARTAEQAARWAERGGRCAFRDEPAFVEAALRRAEADGLTTVRARLEARLDRAPEALADEAQAARARDALRLENLLAARRTLDEINWQACFRALSQVDRTLRGVGAGVYARMDDDSRTVVREQVAYLARRLRVPEVVVARYAADAARQGDGIAGEASWWLCDDEGRRALLERMGRGCIRLARRVPDPSGARVMAAHVALAALLALGLALLSGCAWLLPACAILGWTSADTLIGRFYSRFFPSTRLLKLEMDAVPDDCRTLVVIPALLSGPKRVDAMCDQLEALGCLEADANIEYLLLGDFADAPRRDMPGDVDILRRARARVAAMNARAGREKYALLQRNRVPVAADGIWMGRDRKRGALMDLNRLLLGEAGAASAFAAEGAACERLRGRFRYVLTLDADTRLLPEDVRRLIGAMAHPLNRPDGARGFAVLQPRMEPLPSACVNGFVRLFCGAGGVNAYPVSVSNLWQDVTGRGIYAGKGIYDFEAFTRRVDGALPEGRVLSHDLIEGALAGAGFVSDVAFYDGYPTSLAALLRRLHRWTRGDWQLLPLFRHPSLSCADRFRMLDNLIRSLRAPALLALVLCAAWTGGWTLVAALAVNYLEPLLNPGAPGRLWRRATAELAILPATAWCTADAALRALWRAYVSGRHLMAWVTAADVEHEEASNRTITAPCRAAAVLALPGLLLPGGGMVAIALAALFLVAPGWIGDMEREPAAAADTLNDGEKRFLTDVARDTWRFFEATVPPGGGALPPDNVQLDPPVGAARRTSPTNVALYLLSCLSATRLGFIGVDEARERMATTVGALERMEKWRGHPLNWVDIDTLAPLPPRYVSSVDSGNLAAALLACANAPEVGAALGGRMRAMAAGMDFAALYDGERELFAIGMDADTGDMSRAHYDLLASEARTLSYVAMMLGQVSERHWRRLGRPCAAVCGGVAPLSWSGTMFEYLMPALLMDAPARTLLGEGQRAVVAEQIAWGKRLGRPWGVSESGCAALDGALNYQYRAFGLKELALSGESESDVVAPYAAALAATVAPREAAANLMRMADMGWRGEWGFYEAADYSRSDADGTPTLVKSHMAHHQGMLLCALCNALTGDSLRRDFMDLPQARALSLLLEERCGAAPRRRSRVERRKPGAFTPPRLSRQARTDTCVPETHLLFGGGATALCTSDGAVHYSRFGVDATRFAGSLQDRADRACVHLRDEDSGACAVLGGDGSARLEPGAARFTARLNRLEAALSACVSPEDGTLVRVVELKNAGERPLRVAVTDVVPVALARPEDYRAHAIFKNLFVESVRLGDDALLFRRRPGSRGADGPRLIHLMSADIPSAFETDYDRLVGREGDSGRPGGIAEALTGAVGVTLNPVSALGVRLELVPGQRVRLHTALALLEGGAAARDWLAKWRGEDAPVRALRLACAQARAALGFSGLSAGRCHVLHRAAALLADGRLAAQARGMARGEDGALRASLWPLGLSGERAMLVLSARRTADAQAARELIRAHGFYCAAGLCVDLVLIDDGEGGYARPVRDALERLVAASHLHHLRSMPGGAWLLDGGQLTEAQRRALRRGAAATFDGGDIYARLRTLLSRVEAPRGAAQKPMATGASTLRPERRLSDNGMGGFLPEGGYGIDVRAGALPPAPWCDVLANDRAGLLLSERGGGFFWHGNSRTGRLTPYAGDALREGWGLMSYLTDGRGEYLPLLPGSNPRMPFRARFDASAVCYAFETRRLAGTLRFAMRGEQPEISVDIDLENRGLRGDGLALVVYVDWLMGSDSRDAVVLNAWHDDGACMASGAMPGVGWLAAMDAGAMPGPGRCAFLGRGTACAPEGVDLPGHGEGWTLRVPLCLPRGGEASTRLVLGWSEDAAAARARVNALRTEATPVTGDVPRLTIDTPDESLNHLFNDFLWHQARAARVCGRAGLYQPGGAYGFRDQLQDMLALMHDEPARAREHLLRCAARQFAAGDVMHWWHEPYTGVRTRVSDDLLFLPYVTAAYVRKTGDVAVLGERVPFLEDVELPDGQTDVYRDMRPSGEVGTLHAHCMRAFRRAARTGGHGLMLMGTGDWNDGMNRVGSAGRGESVWLSQFAIACADAYRAVIDDENDRAWLEALVRRLRIAVEVHGWDGGWYLRAYDDAGAPLGSAKNRECRIDAISQAWAVLAGLDGARCRMAMDAAWERLVDEEHGLIGLLTPPFDGRGTDPGYIRAYPAGVRENGGQYTHGALWLLLALIRMGDEDRAHRALQMLAPFNHADTPQKARRYRVEPYVMAADVYDRPGMVGRGGWTWYTGAAGWMFTCVLALLGYERRGDRVRLDALLGEWPRAAVTVPFGGSAYRLVCEKSAARVTLDGVDADGEWIEMVNDGKDHEAVFPPRK